MYSFLEIGWIKFIFGIQLLEVLIHPTKYRIVLIAYKYDISIVVPLFNEEESLPELVQWIEKVVKKNNYRTEVLLIDDGSKDNSCHVILCH